MFDTIGRTRRPNRQRQAGSMLISVSVFTTAVGALMLMGGQTVQEVQVDDEPVEVTFFDAAAVPRGNSPSRPARGFTQHPAPLNSVVMMSTQP